MIWGSLGNSEEDLLPHASHCIPLGRGGTRLRGGGLKAVAQLETQLSVHLPQLSPAQRGGLACWVVGTVLAGSACLHAVFSMLATEVTDHGRWRQLLRMWMRDQPTAQGWYRGPAVEVRSCFAPLLRWILSLWQGTELVLALDPTSHRDRVVALAVSVVYRGCALPVAWQVVPAQRSSGSWVQAYCDLLPLLAAAIPPEMQVTVLCDRGIASLRLWEAICRLHWHPYMRYQQHITFQSRLPARAWVTRPGESCVVAGTAFGPGRRRRCTLVAVWAEEMQEPWILLTDQPPAAVSLEVYGLRVWIEQGFRILKREGWHWHRTRRLDPARVDRHWLVMAIATVQVLAYGTRVEDAALLGRHPWHLTQAPATLPGRTQPRKVSVFRLGLAPLCRLYFQGRTWKGLWLCPESTRDPPCSPGRPDRLGHRHKGIAQRTALSLRAQGRRRRQCPVRPTLIRAGRPVRHSPNPGCCCLIQHVFAINMR